MGAAESFAPEMEQDEGPETVGVVLPVLQVLVDHGADIGLMEEPALL